MPQTLKIPHTTINIDLVYTDAKKLSDQFIDVQFISLVEQCIKNKENITIEQPTQWKDWYCEHVSDHWNKWWEHKGCKIEYSKNKRLFVLWYIKR